MITAKAAKTAKPETPVDDRLELRKPSRISRAPYLLGAAIMAIAAYFKSAGAGSAADLHEETGGASAPTGSLRQPAPGPEARVGAADRDAADQTDDTAPDTAPKPAGLADNVVSLFAYRGGGATEAAPRPSLHEDQFFSSRLIDTYSAPETAAVQPEAPEYAVGQRILPIETQAPRPALPLNHAPVSKGPVRLPELSGSSAVLLALAGLLEQSSDADGDQLAVGNFHATAGKIVQTPSGPVYIPDPAYTGEVVLTYDVTDGQASVSQTASFHVSQAAAPAPSGPAAGTGPAAPADPAPSPSGNTVAQATGANGGGVLTGTEGCDVLTGGEGDDLIRGLGGDDRIDGGGGQDQLYGGNGDDQIFGGDGHDHLYGDAGRDLLFGGSGEDQLYGGAQNDQLDGGDGDDLLSGDDGDDILIDSFGRDQLFGGAGSDRIVAALDSAADDYRGDAPATSPAVSDTAPVSDRDTLDYGNARKSVVIDLQSETARGEEIGKDHISGFETLITGAGDDLVIAAIQMTTDSFDGGAGHDRLDYAAVTEDLTIDLAGGTAIGTTHGADTFAGFEDVGGGTGNDLFVVTGGSFEVSGGGGDDAYRFEWHRTEESANSWQMSRLRISDFGRGDRIDTRMFNIFERDEAEGALFERDPTQATNGATLQTVSWHLDHLDTGDVTVIRIGMDDDPEAGIVELDGHHALFLQLWT